MRGCLVPVNRPPQRIAQQAKEYPDKLDLGDVSEHVPWIIKPGERVNRLRRVLANIGQTGPLLTAVVKWSAPTLQGTSSNPSTLNPKSFAEKRGLM